MHNSKSDKILKGASVAIIDKSRSFSLGIALLLKNYQCQVKTFEKADEAISYLLQLPADIIIGDADFFTKVKNVELLKHLPFILLVNSEDIEALSSETLKGVSSIQNRGSVKDFLLPEMMTLLELIKLRKKIGPIFQKAKSSKHDLANILGILEFKLNKLEKSVPEVSSQESFTQLRDCISRLELILEKSSEIVESLEDFQ